MKVIIIIGIVLVALEILTIVYFEIKQKALVKKLEKENYDMSVRYEKQISELKLINSEKDKLKVEADEEKRKIRTGNKYDNYINGVNQLREYAEESGTDKS